MQLIPHIISITLFSFLVSQSCHASEDARDIMDRVDAQQRAVSDATLSLSHLSSCPFSKKGKKIVCTESPREKLMESVTKQLGEHKKDSQSISIILEPVREKGIGMLTYSYDDDSRDTESWLYLSALGKVKRMASGSGEDREPVSLFGSEFTTEDMESGQTDEYEYKILQQGEYSGREVWVIEALPKPIRLRKTDYSKTILWIDKARLVALKIQTYDRQNKLFKRTVFKKIEQINELWFARDMTMFNLKINRLSRMKTEKISMGVEVKSEFLTQRSLMDFAFREQNLSALRLNFK